MKDIPIILSVVAIILCAIAAVFGYQVEYAGSEFLLASGIMIFAAIAVIAFAKMYPSFGNSSGPLIVSLVLCACTGMFALETYMRMNDADTTPLMIASFALTGLVFIVCPLLCMQTENRLKDKVIGVVSAHDRISMTDLGKRTGLHEDVVSSIVYNAIGKGKLQGRMDGDIFKREGKATAVSHDAKVLVICPYCGAKTEQGLSKCQKCGADI